MSAIATDRIPLPHFTIREVAERIIMRVVLELDKQFYVDKLSHHIEVFTKVWHITFGELCDNRFEKCLGVKSIPSKPCHVVCTHLIHNDDLYGSMF